MTYFIIDLINTTSVLSHIAKMDPVLCRTLTSLVLNQYSHLEQNPTLIIVEFLYYKHLYILMDHKEIMNMGSRPSIIIV